MGAPISSRVDRQAGFTLPELILVVAVLGLAVMVAVPSILSSFQFARARSYASQLEMSIRAVRMIAVSTQAPAAVTVEADRFVYTDIYGRDRVFELPSDARIEGYVSPIQFEFLPNGSLNGGNRQVIIWSRVQNHLFTDSWTVSANLVGSTKVVHVKIDPPQS